MKTQRQTRGKTDKMQGRQDRNRDKKQKTTDKRQETGRETRTVVRYWSALRRAAVVWVGGCVVVVLF